MVKCSPIDQFKPVELITPGNVTDINISSHVAGVLPIKVTGDHVISTFSDSREEKGTLHILT